MRTAIRRSARRRRRHVGLCLEGYDACLEAILEVIGNGGNPPGPRLTLLQDCAELCQVAADFLLRRSPRGGRVGRLCAAVCAQGAAACRAAGGRPPLRRCAEVLGLIARELGAEASPARRRARGSAGSPRGRLRR